MKKLLFPIIGCFLVVAMSSCHSESDSAAMLQLQDSLFANYPGKIGAIHINPEDRENLIVALGAPAFYQASAEEKQKLAIEIGAMAFRIFGKDSYIKTGKLVLTMDANNTSNTPPDGIAVDMKIDSIKKAVETK